MPVWTHKANVIYTTLMWHFKLSAKKLQRTQQIDCAAIFYLFALKLWLKFVNLSNKRKFHDLKNQFIGVDWFQMKDFLQIFIKKCAWNERAKKIVSRCLFVLKYACLCFYLLFKRQAQHTRYFNLVFCLWRISRLRNIIICAPCFFLSSQS